MKRVIPVGPLALITLMAVTAQAFANDPSPPKLLHVIPGDSGVYVEIEKRDEDVERNVRYCVYISEQDHPRVSQSHRRL